MARKIFSAALALAVVLLLSPFAVNAVVLEAAGATLPESIVSTGLPTQQSWIKSFESLTQNRVTINYDASGSAQGDREILIDMLDFAISDSPLSESEMNLVGTTLIHFPITLGALEFIYNIPADKISGPLNLTADAIAQIFSRKITQWNDPAILATNPLLTYDGPITPVVRSDGSGSTYAVSQYLDTSASSWRYGVSRLINWPEGVTSALHSSGVANAVATTAGSIGYARWGIAAEKQLGAAQLKNVAGYWTKPSQASVLAACLDISPDFGGIGLPEPGQSWATVSLVNEPGHSTYPVVTFSYAIVRQDMTGRGEKGAAVANFIRYVNQESSQAIAPAFHFVPLPLFVRQYNEQAAQTIELAPGHSSLDFYNPFLRRSDSKTAGIISLILSILIVAGLLGLAIKEIHYNFNQDRERGIY